MKVKLRSTIFIIIFMFRFQHFHLVALLFHGPFRISNLSVLTVICLKCVYGLLPNGQLSSRIQLKATWIFDGKHFNDTFTSFNYVLVLIPSLYSSFHIPPKFFLTLTLG